MKGSVAILEYHDVAEKPLPRSDLHFPYVLTKERFLDQMHWLYENGYHTSNLDTLIDGKAADREVVLTFDDGHISNYEVAFPTLKKFGYSATFFVVPQLLGKENYINYNQISEMYEHGMEFGSHSLTHPCLVLLTGDEMVREVYTSKEEIERIIDSEVRHFSAPYGFYNRDLVGLTKRAGYKTLVTERPGYFRSKETCFSILPRFTIKVEVKKDKFIHIVQHKRAWLFTDYLASFVLEGVKKALGYEGYVKMKRVFKKFI